MLRYSLVLTLTLAACSTAPPQQIARHKLDPELVRAIVIASILQPTIVPYSGQPTQPLNCYSTGAGAGVIATCQ